MAAVGSVSAGVVYLIHFDTPYKHARHYVGWTSKLTPRLNAHAAGNGARLMTVIHGAGITWRLARTWKGTRTRERQLKNSHKIRDYCPLCGCKPRNKQYEGGGARYASRIP